MGQLQQVLDTLNINSQDERLKKLNAPVKDVEQKVAMLIQSNQVVIGALNNIISRGDQQSNDDRNTRKQLKALMAAVSDQTKDINRVLSSVEKAVSKDIATINKAVNALPAKFPVAKSVVIPDNSKMFSKLQTSLSNLPTVIPMVDLAGIEGLLRTVMSKLDEPMVVEEVSAPREWDFIFERETFSDKIKSIKAIEIK